MKCPRCKSEDNFRHHRRAWMKILPRTRLYRCDDCQADYLATFRTLTYRKSVMRFAIIMLAMGMLQIGILGVERLAQLMLKVYELLAK